MREVPGSNPGRALFLSAFSRIMCTLKFSQKHNGPRSHGVMVSTLDSESSDPSSNLGRTFTFCFYGLNLETHQEDLHQRKQNIRRARPGFEPGTSRTLSENHTPRPTSHLAHHQSTHPDILSNKAVDRFTIVPKNICFRPGSNRRPCACEAHVITTTLRKPV